MTIVAHTGFSVSSLDEAVRFWTEALDFTLEREVQGDGRFLFQATGIVDREVKIAFVRAANGHTVELTEYSEGRKHGKSDGNIAAIGAAHLAVMVADIKTAVARVQAAGWTLKGIVQPIPAGPRKGLLVAYIAGPDNIVIELSET